MSDFAGVNFTGADVSSTVLSGDLQGTTFHNANVDGMNVANGVGLAPDAFVTSYNADKVVGISDAVLASPDQSNVVALASRQPRAASVKTLAPPTQVKPKDNIVRGRFNNGMGPSF